MRICTGILRHLYKNYFRYIFTFSRGTALGSAVGLVCPHVGSPRWESVRLCPRTLTILACDAAVALIQFFNSYYDQTLWFFAVPFCPSLLLDDATCCSCCSGRVPPCLVRPGQLAVLRQRQNVPGIPSRLRVLRSE